MALPQPPFVCRVRDPDEDRQAGTDGWKGLCLNRCCLLVLYDTRKCWMNNLQ